MAETAAAEAAQVRVAEAIARIGPADRDMLAAAQAVLDAKTKPRRSLGHLEELACRVAAIRGSADPGRLEAIVVVAAADHGVAAEGVSAYPQEVTRQMLANFAAGGAAICVLAREAGAELIVVDAGVARRLADPRIRQARIGPGTANACAGPAMSREQAWRALAAGVELAAELADRGLGIVALGEMGIANTTAASALCAALLPADPAAVCGRGTGLDEDGLRRKRAAVRRALEVNHPDRSDPLAVLAALGGFEIAFLAGLALGAAAERLVVLLDGFITGAAALIAARLAPAVSERLVASHLSPEPGHRLVLEALGLRPLLDLELRLGEGTGAALAIPIVRASLAVLSDMATFAEAGVSDAGR
jgi:nicotinate-nucleotide--dimethylbenzimidazole phosphoribosyltransferase